MWEKLQSRLALALILGCLAILLLRYPARIESFHASPPTDFMVYVRASERVVAGSNPYVASDPSPYKYSPGVLALMRLLPKQHDQAWLVFSTLSILGLALALILGARYHSWRSLACLGIGLALAWKGILETLDYGQLELLILALAVGAGALRIRSPVASGLLAGTLPWFKLPWVLLLLPLILTPAGWLSGKGRKPKRLRLLVSGYCLAWFVWGAAVPSLVFGTERAMWLTHEWLSILSSQPQALYLSDVNQSAWVTALRWLGGDPWLAFAAVALFGGLVLGSLTARSLKITANREVFVWLSPWLVLTQLLNPLSWRWGSVFLVGIPFSIAVMSSSRGKTAWRAALAISAVALWLLQLNPVVKLLGYGHWSAIHGYGVLTAYWVSLLLLSIEAEPNWLGLSQPSGSARSGLTG